MIGVNLKTSNNLNGNGRVDTTTSSETHSKTNNIETDTTNN